MMKKLVVIALFLLPFSAAAGGSTEKAHWVCSQPGYMGENLTYALSHVFGASANDYEIKEKIFEKHLNEITTGNFDSLDDPSCRDFSSKKKAEKYLGKISKKAEKKFKILWVDFSIL